MRNLKKVLSLVLALAMVLSLCMAGASAVNYDDFTDEGTITKKQAVETLVSLNVILGYNGGDTFAPAENVKRSEMATMICRVLAGGDNMIVDATKPVATYADIDGHWAESYIEYCTSLGIVSGKSPTSFDPDANVTAAEAAKMVMTTLGYNADIEGFKGIGWDINVMAKANTLKLLENLQGEISASVPVTREQVAQMLFNALSIDMVQNYSGTNANVWIDSGAERYTQTLLEAKFNVVKYTGVVIANEFASLTDPTPLSAGRTTLQLLDKSNDFTKDTKTISLTTGQDDLGMSVIVYCDKDSNRVVYGDTQDTGLNNYTEWHDHRNDLTGGDSPWSASDLKDADYFVNYADTWVSAEKSDVIRYFEITLRKVNVDADGDPVTDANGVVSVDHTSSAATAAKTVYYRVGDTLEGSSYDGLRTTINTLIDIEDQNKTAATYNYSVNQIVTVDNVMYVATAFRGRATANETLDATKVEYSSWDGFSRYYLEDYQVVTANNFRGNELGNYVKIVDANGDGAVDYIMKVAYTMAKVTGTGKDYSFTTNGLNNARDAVETFKVDASKVDAADELVRDDVVVYFLADGIYHVNVADSVTGVATKVDYKNNKVTVDGVEYDESEIARGFVELDHAAKNAVTSDLFAFVDSLEQDDLTVILYFDNFGNVRAWKEDEANRNLMLLTRANTYMGNTTSKLGYAVETWDTEAREIKGYDLSSKANTEYFIKDYNSTSSVTNDWDKLRGVTMVDPDWTNRESVTNMAAATLNEDGQLNIQYVDNSSNKTIMNTYQLDREDIIAGNGLASRKLPTQDTLYDSSNLDRTRSSATVEQGSIYTSSSTVYYLVTTKTARNGATYVDSVRTYTGYRNVPANIKAEDITAMYAVATLTNYSAGTITASQGRNQYYVADAVVIETNRSISGAVDVGFVYDTWVGNVGSTTTIKALTKDGDQTITIDQNLGQWLNTMRFYYIYDNNTVEPVALGDYAKLGIHAGIVEKQANAALYFGYLPTHIYNERVYDIGDNAMVYTLERDNQASGKFNVTAKGDALRPEGTSLNKDYVIWVADSRGNIQYMINVTDSTVANGGLNGKGRSGAPASVTSIAALGASEIRDKMTFDPTVGTTIKTTNNTYSLWHLWSHITNEPVYEVYEAIIDAWNDLQDVLGSASATAASKEEAQKNFADAVQKQLDNLEPVYKMDADGEYELDSEGNKIDITLATLMSDAYGLVDCEIKLIDGTTADADATLATRELRAQQATIAAEGGVAKFTEKVADASGATGSGDAISDATINGRIAKAKDMVENPDKYTSAEMQAQIEALDKDLNESTTNADQRKAIAELMSESVPGTSGYDQGTLVAIRWKTQATETAYAYMSLLTGADALTKAEQDEVLKQTYVAGLLNSIVNKNKYDAAIKVKNDGSKLDDYDVTSGNDDSAAPGTPATNLLKTIKNNVSKGQLVSVKEAAKDAVKAYFDQETAGLSTSGLTKVTEAFNTIVKTQQDLIDAKTSNGDINNIMKVETVNGEAQYSGTAKTAIDDLVAHIKAIRNFEKLAAEYKSVTAKENELKKDAEAKFNELWKETVDGIVETADELPSSGAATTINAYLTHVSSWDGNKKSTLDGLVTTANDSLATAGKVKDAQDELDAFAAKLATDIKKSYELSEAEGVENADIIAAVRAEISTLISDASWTKADAPSATITLDRAYKIAVGLRDDAVAVSVELKSTVPTTSETVTKTATFTVSVINLDEQTPEMKLEAAATAVEGAIDDAEAEDAANLTNEKIAEGIDLATVLQDHDGVTAGEVTVELSADANLTDANTESTATVSVTLTCDGVDKTVTKTIKVKHVFNATTFKTYVEEKVKAKITNLTAAQGKSTGTALCAAAKTAFGTVKDVKTGSNITITFTTDKEGDISGDDTITIKFSDGSYVKAGSEETISWS